MAVQKRSVSFPSCSRLTGYSDSTASKVPQRRKLGAKLAFYEDQLVICQVQIETVLIANVGPATSMLLLGAGPPVHGISRLDRLVAKLLHLQSRIAYLIC